MHHRRAEALRPAPLLLHSSPPPMALAPSSNAFNCSQLIHADLKTRNILLKSDATDGRKVVAKGEAGLLRTGFVLERLG
jgi:hypothetical protein